MESAETRAASCRATLARTPHQSHPMTPLVPNLQKALDARQWTQAALARKLGWSTAKLSRVANGKQKGVTMVMLKELEDALGFSLAYLMGMEDVAQTDAERALLARYRLADSRDRDVADAALKPRD